MGLERRRTNESISALSESDENTLTSRRVSTDRKKTGQTDHIASQQNELSQSDMKKRKKGLLQTAIVQQKPGITTDQTIDCIRYNILKTSQARKWFEDEQQKADSAVLQRTTLIDRVIPCCTPEPVSSFVCPNCHAENNHHSAPTNTIVGWDESSPDAIWCRHCGQQFTDSHFPGIIQSCRINYLASLCKTLALICRVTETPEYAECGIAILQRLSENAGEWIYLNDETGDVTFLADLAIAYDSLSNACDTQDYPLWTDEARNAVERNLFLEWAVATESLVSQWENGELPVWSIHVFHAYAAIARVLGIHEFADTAQRGYEAFKESWFGNDGYCRTAQVQHIELLCRILDVVELLDGFIKPSLHKNTSRKPGRPPKTRQSNNGSFCRKDLITADTYLELMVHNTLDSLKPDGRLLPIGNTCGITSHSRELSRILEFGTRYYPAVFTAPTQKLFQQNDLRLTPYGLMHLDATLFFDPPASRSQSPGIKLLLKTLSDSVASIPPPQSTPVKRGRKPTVSHPADLPEIYFPAWRTAVLRHGNGSSGSLLAFNAGDSGPCRHRDCLSLYYVDSGRTILGDPACHGDSVDAQNRAESTRNHQLVIVDGEDQQISDPGTGKPAIHMLMNSPRASVVEASCGTYAQCSDYRRCTALLKGPGSRTLLLDIFRVKGGSKHTWRALSGIEMSDTNSNSVDFRGIDALSENETEGNPDVWQAVWKQNDAAHRLWISAGTHSAALSDTPGWKPGSHMRCVKAVREADCCDELESTFIALHEPAADVDSLPVQNVEILPVSDDIGPEALALRITCDWGTYLVFNQFEREGIIDGIRFQGRFGILGSTTDDMNTDPRRWLLSYQASTFQSTMFRSRYRSRFGFENAVPVWTGNVRRQTEDSLYSSRTRPHPWPRIPKEVTAHVLVDTEQAVTAYPVKAVARERIVTQRFPLQQAQKFELAAVHYQEEP